MSRLGYDLLAPWLKTETETETKPGTPSPSFSAAPFTPVRPGREPKTPSALPRPRPKIPGAFEATPTHLVPSRGNLLVPWKIVF